MNRTFIIRLALGLLIGGGLGALMGYFGQCASGTCPLTATPLRGALYGAVLGVLFSFSVTSRQTGAGGRDTLVRVIDSQTDFESLVLAAEQPVLVDFYTDKCPSCRRLAPTMEEIAVLYDGRAKVYKVDIDRSPDISEPFDVTATPLVVLFVDGRQTERLVGLRRTTEFTRMLDHYLPESPKQDS